MAKLQHTFVQGKMNKDLDERLVPNGQYRDAKNIQVSTSEGSDVGAVENILGNTIQNLGEEVQAWATGFGLVNTKCIGTTRDSQNEKIYWFITSDTIDAVLEFNQTSKEVVPVLVDANNVLNFSDNNLITGINILDGMLIWTDNLNEPRIIDIATFKAGSLQGQGEDTLSTHTQVYGRPFIASDVTVIKLKPNTAPSYNAQASLRGGNGTGVTPVIVYKDFTELVSNNYVPIEVGSVVTITTDVSPNWQLNDAITLRASFTNTDNYKEYFEVRATVSTAPVGTTVGITIVAISRTLLNVTYKWTCLLDEDLPMFGTKFPRFSYRWRYANNEYSAFAPWTQAVFVPGEYSYDPPNAYNEAMQNNLRRLTISGFDSPPADVQEVDILYKDSTSNLVYKVDSIPATTSTFTIDSELIYNVLSSEQILRPYDNVPRTAKSQEIIGNRIVYGNYLQNYNVPSPSDITVSLDSNDITEVNKPEQSVKSLRTYQVGIVYLDASGRETPVFVNDSATIKVPKTDAAKSVALQAVSAQSAPSWATHFKYYVKDISNEYYNLILDRYYDSEDGNIWLSFPSAERNKVQIDDFIVLKKEHNSDAPVSAEARYKIIDISNEVPISVKSFRKEYSASSVTRGTASAGFTPINSGLSKFNFDGPTEVQDPEFYSSWHQPRTTFIRFSTSTDTSAFYEVESGGFDGTSNTSYTVSLVHPIGAQDDFLDAAAANDEYSIAVYTVEELNAPAFEGKFFVKINRDSVFEDSVLYNFTDNPGDYTTLFNLPVNTEIPNAPITPSTSIPLPNVPLTWWGWEENAAADQRVELQAPSFGLSTMGLGIAPYWATGTGPGSQGDGYGSSQTFVDNLVAGAVLRFTNTNNQKGKLYEIASVTTTTYTSREPGNTEPSVTFAIELTTPFTDEGSNFDIVSILQRKRTQSITFDRFTKVHGSPNAAIFETEPSEAIDLELYYEASNAIPIASLGVQQTLPYFNCYTFGNGVESNRIRDDFNAPVIGKGVKVSSILEDGYNEERRGAGLIYSGIFNSTSGVNQLNQFIAGLKITKDLNPVYGTIQKLHARDTDLIALCEDKCFKILADKDALFNADGNTNVTSNANVLGQTIPYVGEFGISKNPESFAMYGFRAYFTDKARGAVIRLSRDGITEISSKGMTDYFEDKLKSATGALIGSYDEQASSYNIKIGNEQTSFKEGVDGWSTRLSYAPEFAISLNNDYYSFKDGEIWEHTNNTRANFFGVQENTTVTTIFNDAPTSVKNFKTLSYEGDAGWTASITTNKQSGSVSTWKEREGIYFNYIKGEATTLGNIDTSEFSVQGIADVDYVVDGVGYYDLSFTSDINTSLQVGDAIYFVDASAGNALKLLGDVLSITGLTVRAEWDGTAANEPEDGDFILFAKDGNVNTSGLIGYYAEAELTSAGGTKKELFAVNSEIFISSE